MKKVLIAGAIVFVVLLLNECTNPHWFNGGGCGGWISRDTWLGELFGVDCE